MMIDRLSEKTILVTLMRDDMERYRLRFDDDGEAARRGLTRLMVRVGEECGLDHADKSYLVEALPAGESCLLIITVRTVKRRRLYRIKKVHKRLCCVFSGADALLDWLGAGMGVGGSVYACFGSYYLLPDYPPTARRQAQLSEYGALRELGAVEIARICEHGSVVLEHAPGAQGSRRASFIAAR